MSRRPRRGLAVGRLLDQEDGVVGGTEVPECFGETVAVARSAATGLNGGVLQL